MIKATFSLYASTKVIDICRSCLYNLPFLGRFFRLLLITSMFVYSIFHQSLISLSNCILHNLTTYLHRLKREIMPNEGTSGTELSAMWYEICKGKMTYKSNYQGKSIISVRINVQRKFQKNPKNVLTHYNKKMGVNENSNIKSLFLPYERKNWVPGET